MNRVTTIVISRGFWVVVSAMFFLLSSSNSFGQNNYERPKDVKVVSEVEDGKGNIVRKLQYKQGSMIVTETIIMPKPVKVGGRRYINMDSINRDSIVILVDKSHYTLMVFYKRRLIRNYRAVFGPHPEQNKQMEGDRNTPEGWFTITRLNPKSKYNKFMELSYPDAKHHERFNTLKQRGVIPRNARIGGNVGIHGIWPGGDNMIELGVGWTDGCVALRNADMDDLYKIAGIGTRVFIKK
ncbi:MAG: L,D-transpeptidase [Chitinophagales bacterium]|nr:L,D-transpeptidase [Chitinophagaceae bacterium]MCB9064152.1 L,D-transpeptidase [Chitinophagales bacterium]